MNATVNAAQHPPGIRLSQFGKGEGNGTAVAGWLVVTAIIKIITTLLCLIMKNIICGITFGFCLCSRSSNGSGCGSRSQPPKEGRPHFGWLSVNGSTLKFA